MPQVYIPKGAHDVFTDEYGSDADKEIQKTVQEKAGEIKDAASEAGE